MIKWDQVVKEWGMNIDLYDTEQQQQRVVGYLLEVYLVTALVPSETACLASSPGRMRRTAVWNRMLINLINKICWVYLDFAGRDRGALVVVSETRGLGSDAFEDVVHERVHDGHGLRRDTRVGVDLEWSYFRKSIKLLIGVATFPEVFDIEIFRKPSHRWNGPMISRNSTIEWDLTSLLQDTVDIDGIGLLPFVSALLVPGSWCLLRLGGLLGSLRGRLRRHDLQLQIHE